MHARPLFNTLLDRHVRPEIHLFGREVSAFQVFGAVGLAFALVLALFLTAARGLSPILMLAIAVEALLTFYALGMATKIIVGEEKLVYYHHEIAVTGVTALMLWALRQPILPYLDITILGVGTFMAGGRIGCLMVGCCHGRPSAWGVCYREEHALHGFLPTFVGVRLFPVQALESGLALSIVLVGSILVLLGQAPGAAFAWYIISYGVVRFGLEFLRGDPVRPRLWGFSEAQWTSLMLMSGVIVAEQSGGLPFEMWHLIALIAVALTMGVTLFYRRADKTGRYLLNDPRHVRELASALERANQPSGGSGISVGRTSLGIQVSSGLVAESSSAVRYYTISSSPGGPMTPGTATEVARLIVKLRHPESGTRMVAGQPGIYHVLVQEPSPGEAGRSRPPQVAAPGGA